MARRKTKVTPVAGLRQPRRARDIATDTVDENASRAVVRYAKPADTDQATGADETHARAMTEYEEVWTAELSNRDAAVEDQMFYMGHESGGDQWGAQSRKEREAAGRPCLELNALPASVRQLTGDLRRDTPEIKVLQAGGDATKEVAKVYNGLTRHIQSISDAKAAYITGAEGAAICGQGGWRVVTQYSDDDGFEQDIRIQRIADPLAIMMDPYCREADRSDARYCFVVEDIPLPEFKRRYPDKSAQPLDKPLWSPLSGWTTGDTIRIAEYWCRQPVKKTLYLMPDGSVLEGKDGKPIQGATKTRVVDSHKIVSYEMSAHEMLSGPHPWAGKFIPIAFVAGDEVTISGVTYRRGMVRDAKDPQRMYNYTRSAAAEAIALQPKAPWLVTPDMIAGYEETWDAVGRENLPWLPYIPDPGAPGAKPERMQPALAQAGFDTQAAIASDDIKRVTGIYDASLGARSNETSGVAINARQREGDTTTYLYIDNLARAIRQTGKIIVDLIPKIYDSERIVRTLGEDGEESLTKINAPHDDAGMPMGMDASGQQKLWNDLTVGEYDVVVSTGPSYATRRAEAAAGMIDMIKAAPQLMAVAGDLLVKNLDMPGADEVAERLKRALPPGLAGDDGEAPPQLGPDGQPVPQGPPPPPPEPPNPKDEAEAKLKLAQAKGVEIDNAFKKIELGQLVDHVRGGGMPGTKPGLPATPDEPDAPAAPEGAPPTPQGPTAPPAAPSLDSMPSPVAQADDGMPPMVEIGAIDPAQLNGVTGTGPAPPG